jgi:hypothetical protein
LRNRIKLCIVQVERDMLPTARARALAEAVEPASLITELRTINERLWDVEDALRPCEHDRDFGNRFIALARSDYQLNDQRAQRKRRIHAWCGSTLIEEKSYGEATEA